MAGASAVGGVLASISGAAGQICFCNEKGSRQ
jgi:hypothetical protein